MGANETVDIAQQVLEAKNTGINEVVRLLQHPEDLARLSDIRNEFENRSRAAKAALSSTVQSQVEATRHGMDLLDKAHRHILRLQSALGQIDSLCAESSDLIQRPDKIKLLSRTHANINKVLSELGDIVGLPAAADRCWALVEEDLRNVVAAYEGLVVLTGTCENAKQAWQRNAKAKAEVPELARYLARVEKVMSDFEGLLFEQLSYFLELAKDDPVLLVECVKVVEMQERLDAQYARVKMDYKPKRYKDRFFLQLHNSALERFQGLIDLAGQCNVPNKTVMFDQEGDLVLSVKRDKDLGTLTRVVRMKDGQEQRVDDPEELAGIEVMSHEVFDEESFLDALLDGLAGLGGDLSDAYDYAQPCFPPSYDLFNRLFQTYHVQFAEVLDVLGHKATEMSTRGALRVMDWLQKYMDTLRALGIEEGLVRLPAAPSADPDSLPGMVALMDCYVRRMEGTVTQWFNNILTQDLKGEPKVAASGTLFTPGAVEFFTILNQQVAIIEAMNDHGEVMLQTAQCALRVMRAFQDAQAAILSGRVLSLEVCVALLNNAVTCYEHSLVFADDVQRQLARELREALDVEDVCRGFLEVAKAAARKVVDVMFNDPGMSVQLKALYSTPEYMAGRTTSTLIATVKDYFGDFKVWVEASFVKRVAEAALEELVRRAANMFAIGPPQASAALLQRMSSDEDEVRSYFEVYLKPERLAKLMAPLAGMRELMAADGPEDLALAYSGLLGAPGYAKVFTLEVVTKIITGCRPDLQKKQVTDMTNQAKELWKQRTAAAKGGAAAEAEEGWGWWGRKKQ